MGDSAEEIARDIAAVGRIEAVPTLLKVLCDITGMRFAAVARVSDGTWTACAVQDDIEFGLKPGGQLELSSTLCTEVRASRTPVVIEHASEDPVYCQHHTPRRYKIQSYISVPIVMPGGDYFGNLCAIDPLPAKIGEARILSMFQRFAELIAMQLQGEREQAKLKAALLDERAAGELREQLVAILGHDLRTPLGAIAIASQRLQAKPSEAVVAQTGRDIQAHAKHMSAIVDDVLDFARGRLGGVLDVKPALVERLDEALFGVVGELQEAHPGRTIEWHFDIGHAVVVDRGRVRQLVANLLSNALTHGASGGAVKLSASTAGGDLVLEVWNDGEPLAPEALAKLFEPAWHGAGPAGEERLGLGLHICERIVKAHGGVLAVSSTAGEGTTFTARLPQAAAG